VTEEETELTALSPAILKDLWFPDVEIRNLQSFTTHYILTSLEGIWIDRENFLLRALGKTHLPCKAGLK
jgi:hypothetical protein